MSFQFGSGASSSTGFGGAASSGGLFGNTSSSAAAAPSGGGLFGAASTSNNLFGANNTTTAAPPSTSLFGASANTTAPSSNLFGATSAPTTGTNLFGTANTSNASTNLFGAKPNATTGGGLFGSSALGASTSAPTTSLFGQTGSSNLFGGGAAPSTQSSLFGGAAQQSTGLFPGQTNTQTMASSTGSSWETEVRAIYDAYNPQSPNCRFQYVLYNKVDNPSLTQTSPQFALHSGLWQQATRDNPDPQHLAPVPALGFDALRLRIEQQNSARQHHLKELHLCKLTISKLEEEHDVIKKVTVPEYRQRHAELALRLLRVVAKLDIQQGSGYPRNDAELRLRKDLDALERTVEKTRVNVEGISSGVPMGEDGASEHLKLVENDPNYKRIYEFLDQQRQALQHLIQLLNKDVRDCTIMYDGFCDRINPGRAA